jgi:hypothetical protein
MTIDTSRGAVRYYANIVRGAKDVLGAAEATSDLLDALSRERDEALADIARIQAERAEFVAGVEALAGVMKGERDEALAREAALVKSLVNIQEDATDTPTYGDAKAALNRIVRECEDVLSAPAAAAEARDAALIKRGRREGIKAAHAELERRGMNTSALIVATLLADDATPPADGGTDAR